MKGTIAHVIPGIAGRLIVGSMFGSPPHTTFWVDVCPDQEIQPALDSKIFHAEQPLGSDTEQQDLERRADTLKWLMNRAREAGSVFYIYEPPRAWETAAMFLMAQWSWQRTHCSEIINQLAGQEIDLETAEKAYKLWLEKGSNQ